MTMESSSAIESENHEVSGSCEWKCSIEKCSIMEVDAKSVFLTGLDGFEHNVDECQAPEPAGGEGCAQRFDNSLSSSAFFRHRCEKVRQHDSKDSDSGNDHCGTYQVAVADAGGEFMERLRHCLEEPVGRIGIDEKEIRGLGRGQDIRGAPENALSLQQLNCLSVDTR